MKKALIIVAIVLVIVGAAVFVCAFAAAGYDVTKLGTVKTETNTYTTEESFTKIEITTKETDIAFKPAEDGKFSLVCVEQEKMKHSLAVEDGTLKVSVTDERNWVERIGLFGKSLKMTAFLPSATYEKLAVDVGTGDVVIPADFTFETLVVSASTGDVNTRAKVLDEMKLVASTGNVVIEQTTAGKTEISLSTGDVTINSFACVGDVKIKVSTGNVRMNDVVCASLSTEGSTGDVYLKNVVAATSLYIHRSTGDVKFDMSDAAEITVETSTGDVTGTFRTDKIFTAKASTGTVKVPVSTVGGKCEIKTSTGDIEITVAHA